MNSIPTVRLFTETGATGHAARVARMLKEQGT